jgi:hypothetical protein
MGWVVLYSTEWVECNTLLQATTQNTTKTHYNQNELLMPSPPAALSSLSMCRSVTPPTYGAMAPNGPMKCTQLWVCAQGGWFQCGAPE